jgi:type III pantothenate kinase
MLLAVDVGNSETVIGLFEDTPSHELVDHWRVATNVGRTSDEMALLVQEFLAFHGFSFDTDIAGVAVCSGVPRVTAALRQMSERYFGFPAVVLEAGIKTGMPTISSKGEYLGGTILPGVEVSLDALVGRAAMLRRVELVEPRSVIGRSVVESIQAGMVYGTVDAVDGLVRRFEKELGDCTVVATGGLAGLVGPLSTTIQHHEPWLTLRGLRTIFQKNR